MLRQVRALPLLLPALALCGWVASPAQASVAVVADASAIRVADRDVPLRILHAPGALPRGVVVLSHGTFSSGARYDAVARPWAAAGFVVVLPDHRDANFAETPKDVAQMMAIVASRVNELLALAAEMPRVLQDINAGGAAPEQLPLIAAGHSVGTQVALQVTGLRLLNTVDGSVSEYPAQDYHAAVLLSDPGKMAAMPEAVWEGGSRPVFMVTGPDDYGLMGDGRRQLGFENEVLPPDDTTEVARYLLSIDGLDHQFGGLIHKSVDAAPDTEALAWFLELSTAFLNECVAGAGASGSLTPRRVAARAELRRSGPPCGSRE